MNEYSRIRDVILSLDTFSIDDLFRVLYTKGIFDKKLIFEVLKNMQNDGEIAFKNNYIVLGS